MVVLDSRATLGCIVVNDTPTDAVSRPGKMAMIRKPLGAWRPSCVKIRGVMTAVGLPRSTRVAVLARALSVRLTRGEGLELLLPGHLIRTPRLRCPVALAVELKKC